MPFFKRKSHLSAPFYHPSPGIDIHSLTGNLSQYKPLACKSWLDSGGDELSLPAAELPLPIGFPQAIPLPTGRVALSRTKAAISELRPEEFHEIRNLFVDAIMAAEQLIYQENQYFSSQAIYWSLIARMAAPERSRFQIILMLPDRLPFTEELFLGLPQMKMLRSLQHPL